MLDKIGASHFQDFATYVPGLSSSSSGTGENTIAIRGISTGTDSNTVGVYLDETPLGSSGGYAESQLAQDIDVFDMSRLEVLSGPQGTLYGASTLGGLVKYVTAPPDLDQLSFLVQGEASHTQNSTISNIERSTLNVPLIDGRLGLRADGFLDREPGWVDNTGLGIKDWNGVKSRGGRVSILGKVLPDLSVRLSVAEQTIDRAGSSIVDRNKLHQPVQGKYDETTLIPEPYGAGVLLYSGVVKWNSEWGNVTSASSWQNIAVSATTDVTPIYGALLKTGNLIPYSTYTGSTTQKFTQELRYTSPPSKYFEVQIGGFYTMEQLPKRPSRFRWLC